ncbi:signal peptide containing protein [Theileria equi strain WA]|uniref:Signal peptide containing protein n=1 Tax=Theileria equi strain WA TaxID=1537102 RepID=L1LBY5_THEEQ|nr:signal peptide containing protein [Theileria equi strain WA]EKX72846.1 signal peptide containing protein [Theileria equi strain WA]|eukprot:XP_004832298.1 signal peptide containing protein [Theileria equi strain WA]
MSPVCSCLILLLLGEAVSVRISRSGADSPGEKALISSDQIKETFKPDQGAAKGLEDAVPEGMSLENLVQGERKCHVQDAFSTSLKRSIEDGPLHRLFSGSNKLNAGPEKSPGSVDAHSGLEAKTVLTLDSPLLSECRAMDKVCKVPTESKGLKCSSTEFANLANTYLKFSLCSTEAALNQLYLGGSARNGNELGKEKMLRGTENGKFTYSLLDKRIESFSKAAADEKTRVIYEKSANALKTLRTLFHDCEEALVSPQVQHVLFNRWKMLAKSLCSLANGSDALLSSTFVDPGTHTVRMVIDAEEFLNEATKTFIQAYKPFEALLNTLQKSLLAEIIKLAQDGYENKVSVLTSLMNAKHDSSVDKSAIESMIGLPTSGMQFGPNLINPSLSESLLEIDGDENGHADKVDGHNANAVSMGNSDENGVDEPKVAREKDEQVQSKEKLAPIKSHEAAPVSMQPNDQSGGNDKDEHEKNGKDENKGATEKHATISPIVAIKSVLVPLGIFKIKQNSLEAKLDEEAIANAVKSALLDIDSERMLGKLLVAPQAALYSIYSTIDQMLLSPETNDQIGEMKRGKMVELKGKIVDEVEKFSQTFEGLYDQVRRSVASALEMEEQVDEGFILVSSSSGAKVSDMDESCLEKGALAERRLLHLQIHQVC